MEELLELAVFVGDCELKLICAGSRIEGNVECNERKSKGPKVEGVRRYVVVRVTCDVSDINKSGTD